MANGIPQLPEGFELEKEVKPPEGFVIETPQIEDSVSNFQNDIANSQADNQSALLSSALSKVTGIQSSPKGFEKIKNGILGSIPSIGQFFGGVAGGVGATALTGNPFIGAGASAIGGTGGRAAGRIYQQGVIQFLDNPLKATARFLSDPTITGTSKGIVEQMTPEQRRLFGQEMQKTAVTEAVIAPISVASGGVLKSFGNNFLKEVLGREVAERGTEKGFKKILDVPTDKVPVKVITKVHNWIGKLLDVTGKGVQEAVEKESDTFIPTSGLLKQVQEINPPGVGIKDFDISNAQKKNLSKAVRIAIDLPENASVPQIWEARKAIDKIRYNNSFKQEGLNYLNKLRSILNEPIKGASDDIATSFGRYNTVRNAQTTIGKNFDSLEVEGLPFNVKLEKFSKSLFNGNNDELKGFLKEVDNFLPLEDRAIEDMLDIGAAEALDGPVPGGFFTRLLVGSLGGKRAIAQGARVIKSKPTKIITRGSGRVAPTLISESITDFPKEDN